MWPTRRHKLFGGVGSGPYGVTWYVEVRVGEVGFLIGEDGGGSGGKWTITAGA